MEMSSSGDHYSYDMQSGKLLAHVFVFDEFYPSVGRMEKEKNKRRNDVDQLKKVLEQRKFEVHVKGSKECMDSEGLRRALESVAQSTEEVACLMIFILACEQPHLGAKSYRGNFRFAHVLEPFMETRCSNALIGTPKLFFIQNDVGVIMETATDNGDFSTPRRVENKYPVDLDPDILVGYFERSEDDEPSMASMLVQEMQKDKKRTISSIFNSMVAWKYWSKTPKFSSTLTDNVCIGCNPDPIPQPKPAPAPAQPNIRMASGGWPSGSSGSRGYKDNSDAPRLLRREMELYEEAKRELALRRKNLEMMGYLSEQRRDSGSEEEGDRYARREKYFRSDREIKGGFMESFRNLIPFRRGLSTRDIEERQWMERSWKGERVAVWSSGPYMRWGTDNQGMKAKCAPEDKNANESEAVRDKIADEEKKKENNEPEPMEEGKKDGQPMEEDPNDSEPMEEDPNGDMLLALACTGGHTSYQSAKGSVFIKSICDALENCGEGDDLLNVISVAMNGVAVGIEVSGRKQMPTFTSALRKQLTFGLNSVPTPA